jgi:exonuclease III
VGGGVAILMKKNLSFSNFSLTLPDTIEAIGASIKTSTNSEIDVISIYVPKGDSQVADIELLFNRPNPILIGSDFNGHHSM